MEKIHVLGTGNAMVTQCYNTCYVLEADGQYLLVDCGGGNGILRQLAAAGIRPNDIHTLFISHEHCDHLLGAVWMVRSAAAAMKAGKYESELHIYCHQGLVGYIRALCDMCLQKKLCALFGERIFLHPVADGQQEQLLGRTFTFFDIRSTKAPQFAFTAALRCGKLAFMGDEPVNPACEGRAQGARWLLSEAFCLQAEADRFKPYEKHHSTAADAAKLAARLGAANLVLWHTEESDLPHRKQRYTEEARRYFGGGIYVPDDLDVIELA